MPRKINTKTVYYRRKRIGKTNYRSRLKLLLSRQPRLVIRKSLKNLILQIVDYSQKGDVVLVSVHSRDLKKLGWKAGSNNLSACYLLGMLLAVRAKEKNIGNCVLDIGLNPSIKGCKLYSALKGAADAGFKIPFSDSIFPVDKRIRGEHIADFAKTLKSEQDRFNRQFSLYIKNGLDPEQLPVHFDEIKNKIRGRE
ncbi:50S ribosomal protein L18 [Candidatus Woesearchaeota archaeon]|nr:50S ribosomal protein L18 [Candidatus Woesearchaeota archaeon]MBW2978875.1 50S ribosomal protein L18 [Candidatus Woesearchaeota archaeon]